MLKIKLDCIKIWIDNICPLYSNVVNFLYWFLNINDLQITLRKKKLLTNNIKSFESFEKYISNFKWKDLSFKTWSPWVITIINYNFIGDCKSSAILSKWLLGQIGIKSDIVYLYGEDKIHVIYLAKNKKFFISNNSVLYIKDPKYYVMCIFEIFDFKYLDISRR